MKVIVVAVTFNSEALLADLISSLPGGLGHVEHQLVIVDNDSSDQTVQEANRVAPMATIVQMGRNAGYAAAINAGVAFGGGSFDAVLVLNPDVRLEPNCVPRLIAAMGRTGAGIAVPRLLDAEGELIYSRRREPSVLRTLADAVVGAERAGHHPMFGEVVTDFAAYDVESMADWAEGSTQLISAECWDECGPWDEQFFLYSEETDFGLRARDAGLGTVFVPSAKAIHLEGGSAGSPKLWALLVSNRIRLFRKRHGRARTVAFWAATVLREASRALLGKPTSRAAVKALFSRRMLSGAAGPELIR